METKKYSTSKSKTFDKESEFGEMVQWFVDNIKTEDIEIITNTPPSYDVETRTKEKYKITIVNLNE